MCRVILAPFLPHPFLWHQAMNETTPGMTLMSPQWAHSAQSWNRGGGEVWVYLDGPNLLFRDEVELLGTRPPLGCLLGFEQPRLIRLARGSGEPLALERVDGFQIAGIVVFAVHVDRERLALPHFFSLPY